MPDRPLTAKQSAFCREYTIDHNGKQAAIRAGYAAGSAEVRASELVRISKVKQEIARIEAEIAVKYEHNREKSLSILDRARAIAENQGNPSGMVAAEREKNAISNLHSAIIHTDQPKQAPLTDAEQAALTDIARQYKLKLSKEIA